MTNRYACLIYTEEETLDGMSRSRIDELNRANKVNHEWLRQNGQLLYGQALQSTRTAVTVRVRDNKLSTTDGPFAETREQLGGLRFIEASDLNHAIQVAASSPMAEIGSIEVRPIYGGQVFEPGDAPRSADLAKYMCLVYLEEQTLSAKSQQELDELGRANQAYADELENTGRMLVAASLQSVSTAVTVRVRNAKLSTTDGPFAETREQLGGFYVMQARDLNEAIQVAARNPIARLFSMEVRPTTELVAP